MSVRLGGCLLLLRPYGGLATGSERNLETVIPTHLAGGVSVEGVVHDGAA